MHFENVVTRLQNDGQFVHGLITSRMPTPGIVSHLKHRSIISNVEGYWYTIYCEISRNMVGHHDFEWHHLPENVLRIIESHRNWEENVSNFVVTIVSPGGLAPLDGKPSANTVISNFWPPTHIICYIYMYIYIYSYSVTLLALWNKHVYTFRLHLHYHHVVWIVTNIYISWYWAPPIHNLAQTGVTPPDRRLRHDVTEAWWRYIRHPISAFRAWIERDSTEHPPQADNRHR